MNKHIKLRGIQQNNLKNIDIDIELGSFTVVCGPSGSGKSSLAFESLYAEGQRRFIDSLSNYSKQFLNKAPKPRVDSVENIPPAIALEQKNQVRNSRSTVGSLTEINDYLRLLFSRVGKLHCPNGHGVIKSDTPASALEKILGTLDQKRAYILFKIDAQQRILKPKDLKQNLIRDGFIRYTENISGGRIEIQDLNPKSKLPENDFYIIVDRLAIKKEDSGRILDSIQTALLQSLHYNQITGGRFLIQDTEGNRLSFSEDLACSQCDYSLGSLNPNLFHSSSPVGACKTCNGFGNILQLDLDKIIPNPKLSISKGAIFPFTMPSVAKEKTKLYAFCKKEGIPTKTSWENLKEKDKELILRGGKSYSGVLGSFEKLEEKKYKMHVRIFLSRFKSAQACNACGGSRLNQEVFNVYIHQKNIKDVQEMPLDTLLSFFQNLPWTAYELEAVKEIQSQLINRLSYLNQVGLGYLSLIRETKTLSGGEYQRIKLANQLGMQLSQTLYVLDEPTIGLHPRDNLRLIKTLKDLQELGNTLVIVEHDREVIENATHIIEIGPKSGKFGGELVFSGDYKSFLKATGSVTQKYLKPAKESPLNPLKKPSSYLKLKSCTGHNLKSVSVNIPLQRFTVVTGVSGSGKSSLIQSTLYPALARAIEQDFPPCLAYKGIEGTENIEEVVLIDQKAVGRSGRSNPVTFMGVYDEVRKLFSQTPLAKDRSLKVGYFSLNMDGGRCATCNGDGFLFVDMQFMDDVIMECEDCGGSRFKQEALEIRFQERNIQEVLEMTVDEACDFFASYPKITRGLSYLQQVGLGYIQLGQGANTLSGGESQRLKIAKELAKSSSKSCFYILDEPTTGLHFQEVEILTEVLKKLVSAGATVVVIEHNMELIRQADYVIDLGPDGGNAGGELVYQGGLPGLKKEARSETAKFL